MEVVAAVGYVIGLVVLASAILFIRDLFMAPRNPSAAESAAARAALDARLLAPDWTAFERELGRPAPPIVRRLYADHELLLSAPLVVIGPPGARSNEWDITTFNAVDGTPNDPMIPRFAVCFAVTCTGDPYYVELGPTGDDGPVWVHYHDPDEIERVADSLAEFLSWPREPDLPPADA